MNPATYRKLVAAGLTTDQVAIVMDIMDESEAAMKAAEEARKSVARERVQRWRDKRKADVTLQKHNGNATERLTSADDAPDLENKQTNKPEKKGKGRATRLTADWQIPEEWIDEAVAAGMPPSEAQASACRMKNWSISTTGAVKLDWHATWQNWFARDLKDQRPQHRSHGPPKKTGPVDALRELFEENQQHEHEPRSSSSHNGHAELISPAGQRLQGPAADLRQDPHRPFGPRHN